MDTEKNSSVGLSKYLTPLGTWALTVGCCIGWGSIVMPGTTFLPTAGPLGTVLAIVIGAIIMLLIAANYHYMINLYPDSGGAFTYTKKIFGFDHAFLCAWFLWIAYVSLIWANATAFAVIGRNLFGNFFHKGFVYSAFGYEIYFGEIMLTFMVLIFFGLISLRKKIFVSRLNTILATGFFFGGIILTAAAFGESSGLEIFSPAFSEDQTPFIQVCKMVALTPWAFIGFEVVSHAAEELNFSPQKSFKIMSAAILSAALFYSATTTLAVSAVPENFFNWQKYIDNLHKLDGLETVPTLHAAYQTFGETGFLILGLIILAVLTTSMIGYYFATSRLTYFIARENLLPKKFAALNSENVPEKTLFLIMAMSLLIPFIGRTAIGWLTDVTTVGATIAYIYTSACTYKVAKKAGDTKFKITGALGVIFSAMFVVLLLVPNLVIPSFWKTATLMTESYFILVIWSILGFAAFKRIFSRDRAHRYGKAVIVWILMLFFIFFGALMWMRQSADESISKIVSNYEDELSRFGIKLHAYRQMQEEQYLKIQMEEVRTTLFRGSMVQMILIMASLFIMFSIYSTIRSRERNAEVARLRAEENSRAKTTFLSNMSHDIRTPMNAIIGYTNLARRDGLSLEEVQEFLTKIESSGQHLLNLINDVLEMSRIESGRLELDEKPCDLKKVIRELYDMFVTQMQTKNISFSVDTSDVQNNFVFCDEQKLNRILLNLTSNAYKFTPNGGEIKIVLREIDTGNYELRVKDSGIGMSAEFAKKIFDPFERERTSTVSGIQGTGLGMSITKSFVDLMKGNIAIETAKGKGTEFIISLRFELNPDAQIENDNAVDAEKNSEVDFTQKKLLLAEDIEVNREIALMILTEAGFEVETAVDGADAVEKFSKAKPGDFDAILMDIQMPVMNGYEATKKIRAFDKNIPIIAMTANAFSEDVENAKAAGMNGHIAKPLDITKMMETLREVLNQSSTTRH